MVWEFCHRKAVAPKWPIWTVACWDSYFQLLVFKEEFTGIELYFKTVSECARCVIVHLMKGTQNTNYLNPAEQGQLLCSQSHTSKATHPLSEIEDYFSLVYCLLGFLIQKKHVTFLIHLSAFLMRCKN